MSMSLFYYYEYSGPRIYILQFLAFTRQMGKTIMDSIYINPFSCLVVYHKYTN